MGSKADRQSAKPGLIRVVGEIIWTRDVQRLGQYPKPCARNPWICQEDPKISELGRSSVGSLERLRVTRNDYTRSVRASLPPKTVWHLISWPPVVCAQQLKPWKLVGDFGKNLGIYTVLKTDAKKGFTNGLKTRF